MSQYHFLFKKRTPSPFDQTVIVITIPGLYNFYRRFQTLKLYPFFQDYMQLFVIFDMMNIQISIKDTTIVLHATKS